MKGVRAAAWFYRQSFQGGLQDFGRKDREEQRRKDLDEDAKRNWDFYSGLSSDEAFKDHCGNCGKLLAECPCTKTEGLDRYIECSECENSDYTLGRDCPKCGGTGMVEIKGGKR